MTSTTPTIIPSLPQNLDQAEKDKRAFELSIAKTSYNYMTTYLEPVPMSADLPAGESFSPDYEVKVLKVFLPLLDNFKDVVITLLSKELSGDLPSEAMETIKAVDAAYEQLKRDKQSHSPLKVIKEVEDLYELLHSLAQLPGAIEQAIKGVSQIPGDVMKMIDGFAEVFKEFEKEGFTAFLKNTMYDMLNGAHGRQYLEPKSLADYESLFESLPKPLVLELPHKEWMERAPNQKTCMEDWYFGYMQIAGFNTTNLRGVRTDKSQSPSAIQLSDLLAKMPITDSIFQKVVGDTSVSLTDAAEKGLLYACDYDMFKHSSGGTLHEEQRYPQAPIALFYWNDNPPAGYPSAGAMQPIAIQLGQSHDSQNTPIFTPNDCTENNDANGAKWQIAKLVVQNACTIQHETVAHLGACHLTIEPMIVAAHRQLPENHPLFVLLKPHFRFTLDINNGALHSLIVPGGVVASVISTSHQATGELIVDAHEAWRFDQQYPDKLFKERGVAEASLSSFPFREDTLDLWNAISTFVRSYLSIYYSGNSSEEQDAQVKADFELQSWINEMVSQKYACVKGMDGLENTGKLDQPFQIAHFDYLVRVVSLIIYTASAQHAAVNFAQYPLMSYIPAATGTLYKTMPTSSESLSEDSLVSWLPPLDVALYQVSFAYLLTGVQYDRLGYYSDDPRVPYFQDHRVAPVVSQFQMDLNQAEINIHKRNQNRPFPYIFQLPSMVPNSISI